MSTYVILYETIVYIFSSYFLLSPPLIQFCICTYVFTAAFCLQFIKEYDDDDDDLSYITMHRFTYSR